MNELMQTVVTVVGLGAGCVAVRAAAELLVRHWDQELHGTRGRRLDKWT